MFSFGKSKSSFKTGNRRRVNPLMEQVRKVLTNTDQRLIVMVRG